MEISAVSQNCIRIRGKHASFVVDPDSLVKTKIVADAVLMLGKNQKAELAKIEGSKVVIQGAGDYEVSGVKIHGVGIGDHIVYELLVDGVLTLLGRPQDIASLQDKKEYHCLVVNIDAKIESSLVAELSPSLVVLYGVLAQDGAKQLGKESVAPTAKHQILSDKLPAEMEVIILQ